LEKRDKEIAALKLERDQYLKIITDQKLLQEWQLSKASVSLKKTNKFNCYLVDNADYANCKFRALHKNST